MIGKAAGRVAASLAAHYREPDHPGIGSMKGSFPVDCAEARIGARIARLDWMQGVSLAVPHRLGPGVSVWRLDVPSDAIVPPELLERDELQRAARMNDRVEAHRYLASRAALRGLLGELLGQPAHRLQFAADERGKPRLADDRARFSLSRSGAAVLIGVSARHDIGVDIERCRDVPELESLARTHLSDAEYQAWRSADGKTAHCRFLSAWTRKEACVKAAGVGLALPLPSVEVGCDEDSAPRRVQMRYGRKTWTAQVASLPMPAGCVAAVAAIAH